MGLLQNIMRINAEPIKFIGSTSASPTDRCKWNRPEQFGNKYIGFANISPKTGVPSGYLPMAQFEMPRVDGGIASFVNHEGSGSVSINSLSLGRAIDSSVSGTGTLSQSDLSRLYMCIADLSGTGDISSAAMAGAVQLVIELLGSGDISTPSLSILAWCNSLLEASGTIVGPLDLPIALSADLSGEGEISAALIGIVLLLALIEGEGSITPELQFPANLISALSGEGELTSDELKGLLWCVANLLGEGDLDGDIRGKMNMIANLSLLGGSLTAGDCAAAVWSALAANYNSGGTMGEKLNAAGTAGDPWTAELPGSYVEGTAGYAVSTLSNQMYAVSESMDAVSESMDGVATADSIEPIQLGIDAIQGTLSTLTENMGRLLDVSEGNWEIVNNQMVFYTREGDVLLTFDLLNKRGVASDTEVFKRVKV